jgi:hypothetical protein
MTGEIKKRDFQAPQNAQKEEHRSSGAAQQVERTKMEQA